MKVIEQIIDYLHYEDLISEEEFNVLKLKGFYPKINSKDYTFDYEHWHSDLLDQPETKDWDETFIDKLRKVKTKRSSFRGSKKRQKVNKIIENQVNLNLDHLWVNIKNDIDYESFINHRELLDFLKWKIQTFIIIIDLFQLKIK